jgi:hypothetical protein
LKNIFKAAQIKLFSGKYNEIIVSITQFLIILKFISFFSKKKISNTKQCHFERHYSSSPSPGRAVEEGEDVLLKIFFYRSLFLSLSLPRLDPSLT